MTIKTHYDLLILAGCLLFVINIFFFTKTENGVGIFGKSGTIFSPLIFEDAHVNEGAKHLNGFRNGYIPSVRYKEGVLRQGDCVEFKGLLEITLENGTTVGGVVENDFAIYLVDIRTKDGNSVLEVMHTEELMNMEEIQSSFLYDKEMDLLYVFGCGTYIVTVKIYSQTGGMEIYEFQIPVELN